MKSILSNLRPVTVLSADAPPSLFDRLGADYAHLVNAYVPRFGRTLFVVNRLDIEGEPPTQNEIVEAFRAAFAAHPEVQEIQLG